MREPYAPLVPTSTPASPQSPARRHPSMSIACSNEPPPRALAPFDHGAIAVACAVRGVQLLDEGGAELLRQLVATGRQPETADETRALEQARATLRQLIEIIDNGARLLVRAAEQQRASDREAAGGAS